MRRLAPLLAAVVVLACAPSAAHAALGLLQVGSYNMPTYVTGAPGDYSRLYVVEQTGRIKVIVNGQTRSTPFADLRSRVLSGGERGLLGLAFRPDYKTSRLLYVFFTDAEGDMRVQELRAPTGDRADPSYARDVIEVPHPEAGNHNAGQLAFGRDGYLYVATGDGGNGYDEPVRDARDVNSLRGKILRVAPKPGGGYSIPSTNPFVGSNGADQVWAYGFRNPYRFSFDRATGDIAIGDVGQSTVEEVNYVPASRGAGKGSYFGWDDCEGDFRAEPKPTTTAVPCSVPSVRPVISRLQSDGNCSVIGGYVVRDPTLVPLVGRYVYGDFCRPQLRSALLRSPRAAGDRDIGLRVSDLSSFGEDTAGCLYAASLDGPVYRVVFSANQVPCPQPASPAATDTSPPRLKVRVRRRQRVLRHRGVIARVRVNERGTVKVTARLRIGRRSYRLRTARKRVRAHRRAKLKVRLTRRSRRALRRALRQRRRARMRLHFRARDLAGNRSGLVRRKIRPVRSRKTRR